MRYFNCKLFYVFMKCIITRKPVTSVPSLRGVVYCGAEYEVDWERVNYKLEHQNLVCKEVGQQQVKADILSHKNNNTESPVIIYSHGGEWNKCNKTYIHRPMIEVLFQRLVDLGYRVVSVDYRTCSPHTPVEMAISDIKDVVRWVKKNGAKYKFDKDNIILMGASAGGHISMMAAYSDDSKYRGDSKLAEYSSMVDGLINCYGPVEVLRPFRFRMRGMIWLIKLLFPKSLYPIFTDVSHDFSGLKYPEQAKELRAYMKLHSVTSIVNPRNIPTLTVHGLKDFTVQPANAKVLNKYLIRNGIESTMRLYRGVSHSLTMTKPEQLRSMGDEIENFLSKIKQ